MYLRSMHFCTLPVLFTYFLSMTITNWEGTLKGPVHPLKQEERETVFHSMSPLKAFFILISLSL